MRDIIIEKIREIERKHTVKVLLAVESGSRAWGVASPDSDYDVRFIYVKPLEWYVSVAERRDTIESMSPDRLLDFSGWELRKTLRLLGKTNPNLSDWLMADDIYLADREFLADIRQAQREYYNPISAIYHFYNISKRHDVGYLQRNGCTIKRFLYFLRGVLACEYISRHRCHPPVAFLDLVDATVEDPEIREMIYSMIALKSQSKEHDTVEVSAALRDYAFAIYDRWNSEIADFRPARDFPSDGFSPLDALLLKYVLRCWQ